MRKGEYLTVVQCLKVNEEKENDQQKKVDTFDKNNELTHNDREAPFSNTSTSSKGKL